ncbi:hypothetical protein RB195_014216 [Necator americanus]|uniref:Uncharacterized protein n=1 Tax=Necator americanus TaxID=51031 RepID=A0ABR1E1T8_NECAM
MASNSTDDMFTKKRKAEERKLIEEIRYKRSCIRLPSMFPAEEEIQTKIRRRNVLQVSLRAGSPSEERRKSKDWQEDPTSGNQDPVRQRNVGEEEVEEDLLDLYDEYERREQKDASERASTYTNESI